MENNYYSQPQYNQQYAQPVYAQVQQPVDPAYNEKVKGFLTKAIVACAISCVPVGSIIAIIMGSKNRTEVLDYINQGGPHTIRIKVCSCLSRAAKYAGIGYTIFWAFYLLYFILFMLTMVLGIVTQYT